MRYCETCDDEVETDTIETTDGGGINERITLSDRCKKCRTIL